MPEPKADLRRRLRAARATRDAAALAAAGTALAGHAEAGGAPGGGAFAGTGGEPPTLPLLAALLARGARVLLPVLLPDFDLDWAAHDGSALAPGRRGTLEPLGARLGRDGVAAAGLVLAPAL